MGRRLLFASLRFRRLYRGCGELFFIWSASGICGVVGCFPGRDLASCILHHCHHHPQPSISIWEPTACEGRTSKRPRPRSSVPVYASGLDASSSSEGSRAAPPVSPAAEVNSFVQRAPLVRILRFVFSFAMAERWRPGDRWARRRNGRACSHLGYHGCRRCSSNSRRIGRTGLD